MKVLLTFSVVFVTLSLLGSPAAGVLMTVNSWDDPNEQDGLFTGIIPVHELGNQPLFPSNERITSSWQATTYTPCSENPDDPNIINARVTITNKTGRVWEWLYYVADPETSLSNNDGLVNDCLAFQIDWRGKNTPLVYESLAWDNRFEIEETWCFVIQDYTNSFGLGPSKFGSVGVGNNSLGDTFSSGSIIPEPCTMALLTLGGLAMLRRKRRTA